MTTLTISVTEEVQLGEFRDVHADPKAISNRFLREEAESGMIRRFVRDSLVTSFPLIASRGAGILLIPLYTRVLAPADYGSLDLLIAFGSIINLLLPLEVSQGVSRYYSDSKRQGQESQLCATAFRFSLIVYSIFALVSFAFAEDLSHLIMGRPGLETEFLLGVSYIAMNGIFILGQVELRFSLRPYAYAAVSLVQTIVLVGATSFVSLKLELGLVGILASMVTAYGIATLSCLWLLRLTWFAHFDRDQLLRLLRYSLPLVPSAMGVFVNLYIGRLSLSTFHTLSDVGVYGVAFRVASITLLLSIGVNAALMPLVYARHQIETTPRNLAQIFWWFALASAGVCIGIAVSAKWIINLLAGEGYSEAASVVAILVPALVVSQMYIFFPGPFIAEKTKSIMAINLLGALINTTLVLIFVPSLAAPGAALASLVSNSLVFGAYVLVSQRLYPVPHRRWSLLLIAATTVTVCLVTSHRMLA